MALTKEEAARRKQEEDVRRQREVQEKLKRQAEDAARIAEAERAKRQQAEDEWRRTIAATLEKLIDETLLERYKLGNKVQIPVPRRYGASPPDEAIKAIIDKYQQAGWQIRFGLYNADLEYYFFME